MSVVIRSLEQKDCPVVARMHNEYIPVGTLNVLGNRFAELIFRTLVDSPSSFCLVAEDQGRIIGFVAGTMSMKKFYREFFGKFPFKAPATLLTKMLNPNILRKVYRLSRYPWNFPDLPDAEGISFVVDPQYRKTGLTFLLWQRKAEAFKSLGVKRVRIGIHSSLVNNQRFFEQLGLKYQGEAKLSDTDGMKVYIWDLNSPDFNISKPI